jgi:hypothetical protein
MNTSKRTMYYNIPGKCQSDGVKRAPLRSMRELAEALGMPIRTLAGIVGHAPDKPKPQFKHKSEVYFNHAEFLAWWAKRATHECRETRRADT